MFKSVETNPNYEYAVEAMQAVHARFPDGANNQADNMARLKLPEAESIRQMQLSMNFTDALNPSSSSNLDNRHKTIQQLVSMTLALRTGNCESFSVYAIGFLGTKYPNEYQKKRFEVVYTDFHVFMVIGRASTSKPKNIKTWGKEALTCICEIQLKSIIWREIQKLNWVGLQMLLMHEH